MLLSRRYESADLTIRLVMQLVHVPVDLMELQVFIEVRLEVLYRRRLAHRLAHTGNGKMTENIVLNRVEADTVIYTVQDDLRSVQRCTFDMG